MVQPTCHSDRCPNPKAIGVYCLDHSDLPPWLVRARRERHRLDPWITETRGLVCTYCGETANANDHLISICFSGPSWRKYVPTVPACQECNSTLSDCMAVTAKERSAVIHRRLRAKNAGLLKVVRHRQEPVESFDGTLRTMVEARRATREVLLSRLAYLAIGGACEADVSAFND